MLAITEEWDTGSDCYTDKTVKYVLLLLSKLGLDTVVFYSCCRKQYTFFLSVCSLSIILGDLVIASLMATVWFLGAEQSFTPCFLLANASTIYSALPLPMMCLGLLDYCLGDTCLSNQRVSSKTLGNVFLTFLVWMLAVIYSFSSTDAELIELDYGTGIKALVCEVEESTLITYSIAGLFTAVLLTVLPFLSRVPQWIREADKISVALEEQEITRSDLLFTSTMCNETNCNEKNYLEEITQPQPPLWLSLTLGFGTIWMPFLAFSVGCVVFGFTVPAYIFVNVLLLECTNSVLVGVVFWVKSNTLGPYSHLPENVCLWSIYWHLSKGMQEKHLPIAVFNPSKGKRNTFYV